MIRLILDTDIGNGIVGANTDDGLALGLILASKEIKLEMISTLSGNVQALTAYSVAKDLLNNLNLDIPLYLGAHEALYEDSHFWRQRLDKSVEEFKLTHLWNHIKPIKILDNINPNACMKMGELIMQNPGEISICAIGPLTNIAIAMKLFKDFDKNVKEIFIMGGSFDMPYHIKDTNFGFDPEAANIVLNSRAKITLVPYNATMQTMLTHEDLNALENQNPLCDFLVQTLRVWIDYASKTRGTNGTWIHDALTIAYMLDPNLANFDEYLVDVVCDSTFARGSTIRCFKDAKMPMKNHELKNTIKVLKDIDNVKLLNLLKSRLLNGICYENYKSITT
ncbi:nucleoside hydrolase [Campylobacter lari]|nr:nucleoside hydrolase [Campylobacter lari]EAJ5683772.1 nucleoside hydrolase [Campylobacter lari]